MLSVVIVCSDQNHPIYPYLHTWVQENSKNYTIELVARISQSRGHGDFLFLISCNEIVDVSTRSQFKYALVLHASNLPHGRGWSPMIWQLLEGSTEITVSLLEADDPVDTGDIWAKLSFPVAKHELLHEINHKLFITELILMQEALQCYDSIKPVKQINANEISCYPKRSPEDSKIDVNKSIAEQFNLLRLCEDKRYPAFFEMHDHIYKISIEKMDKPTIKDKS